MKLLICFLTTFCLTFLSCSKKNDTPTNNLAETPSAKSQYDDSNYGIYKGVFTGSSGVIIIDINNNGTISATLIIDGTTYNFTTTQTIQQNQPTTITFVSGVNTFTFTVGANGANPTITNLFINGHPSASILVVKETSIALVKCFEGTYTGGDVGIFNAVIYNNLIKGLVQSVAGTTFIVDGTVTNNQISASGSVTSGATFTGNLSGNTTSGTWLNTGASLNGTWSGIRTY